MVLVMDGERDDGPLFGIRPQRLIPGRAIAVIRGSNQGQCHIAQNIPEIAS
ncbi:type VII secretion protein EccCb [Corynebacterium diphtheriae]|nr:type VII secretion protein EccCb [Corynebacterium diphtheriae]